MKDDLTVITYYYWFLSLVLLFSNREKQKNKKLVIFCLQIYSIKHNILVLRCCFLRLVCWSSQYMLYSCCGLQMATKTVFRGFWSFRWSSQWSGLSQHWLQGIQACHIRYPKMQFHSGVHHRSLGHQSLPKVKIEESKSRVKSKSRLQQKWLTVGQFYRIFILL